MSEHDPTAPPEIAIVQEDRLCERCGFNLYGTGIEREPKYGLLIAACPKCGRRAALEAYPRLGPWAGRWGMLLAALWLLVLVVVGIGGLVFVTSMSTMMTIEITDRFERQFRDDYQAWLDRTRPDQPSGISWSYEHFDEFWAEDGPAILADPAWKADAIELDELPMYLVPGIGAFVAGVFWSLATLAGRRRTIVGLAAGVLALYLLAIIVTWIALASTGPVNPAHVVWLHVRMGILIWVLPTTVAVFLLGLFAGRPLIRGLVRALLPPRFRGALSLLWTSSGESVPWRADRTS